MSFVAIRGCRRIENTPSKQLPPVCRKKVLNRCSCRLRWADMNDDSIEHVCYRKRRWSMKIVWVAFPPQLPGLFDADGDRHTEAGHSVERVAGDFCVGLLIGQIPGMKAPADDGLVSIHRRFSQASPAKSGATLPSDAAVSSDRTKMAIALCRAGLTQNGCRPRRDNHPRRGMPLQHFIVDRVAVVGSIGCHRTDRALDLVQQIREG